MMSHRIRQKRGFIFFLLMCSLALGGCATTTQWTWEHVDHLDQAVLAKDREECRNIARQEANQHQYDPFYYDDFYFWPYQRWGRYPFSYWGWSHHSRFELYQDNLERYFNVCMKAKGWSLVRKPIKPDQEQSPPLKK